MFLESNRWLSKAQQMNLALPNLSPWGSVCKTRNDHLTSSDRKARDAFAVRKTLNGKQGLMLAWGESGVLGRLVR
jgi:hypothetical protein